MNCEIIFESIQIPLHNLFSNQILKLRKSLVATAAAHLSQHYYSLMPFFSNHLNTKNISSMAEACDKHINNKIFQVHHEGSCLSTNQRFIYANGAKISLICGVTNPPILPIHQQHRNNEVQSMLQICNSLILTFSFSTSLLTCRRL